jgi:hypothetical protein
VLAVLLVLLGTSAVVAPPGAPTGELASAATAHHQELNDWLRLSGVARHALPAGAPDCWWAVYPGTTGAHVPRGSAPVGALTRTEADAATPISRSSRAPPPVR